VSERIKIVKFGLASEVGLDLALDRCARAARDPDTYETTFRLTQVGPGTLPGR
jgi:hypothetical protein